METEILLEFIQSGKSLNFIFMKSTTGQVKVPLVDGYTFNDKNEAWTVYQFIKSLGLNAKWLIS